MLVADLASGKIGIVDGVAFTPPDQSRQPGTKQPTRNKLRRLEASRPNFCGTMEPRRV